MTKTVEYNPTESLGYRWDLEDRDRLYANGETFRGFAADAYAAPEEIDPRSWLPTKHQGGMGSCRGHSGSTGAAYIHRMVSGQYVDLSPMWVYLRTQKRDGLLGRDSGSTIENGVRVMKEEGVCRESVFPYPRNYSTRIPEGAADDAKAYRIGRYSPIENYDQAREWLASGQGYIDIGVQWPFRQSRGRVTSWQPTGRGGHAMAFCGYLRSGELILFNSHGTQSGDDGEFLWTPEAFNAMCRDRRSSVIGVSDMPTAKPRVVDWLADSVNA